MRRKKTKLCQTEVCCATRRDSLLPFVVQRGVSASLSRRQLTPPAREATSPKAPPPPPFFPLPKSLEEGRRRRRRRRRKEERRADMGEALNKSCLFAVAVSLRENSIRGNKWLPICENPINICWTEPGQLLCVHNSAFLNSPTPSEIHFPSRQKTCSDFLLLSPFFYFLSN